MDFKVFRDDQPFEMFFKEEGRIFNPFQSLFNNRIASNRIKSEKNDIYQEMGEEKLGLDNMAREILKPDR